MRLLQNVSRIPRNRPRHKRRAHQEHSAFLQEPTFHECQRRERNTCVWIPALFATPGYLRVFCSLHAKSWLPLSACLGPFALCSLCVRCPAAGRLVLREKSFLLFGSPGGVVVLGIARAYLSLGGRGVRAWGFGFRGSMVGVGTTWAGPRGWASGGSVYLSGLPVFRRHSCEICRHQLLTQCLLARIACASGFPWVEPRGIPRACAHVVTSVLSFLNCPSWGSE